VPGSVPSAAAALRQALAGFEPGLFSGAECARVAEELAATEKACAAARLLAAGRAVESGAHGERGFKDGASWLAQQSGCTGTQARQALETASRLGDCPDTKAALLAGEISLAHCRRDGYVTSQLEGVAQSARSSSGVLTVALRSSGVLHGAETSLMPFWHRRCR
jgi:hypothetical protein